MPGEALGVHPALRLTPPRALWPYSPPHLLPCHGEPVEGDDLGDRIRAALDRSRRDIPRWLVGVVRNLPRP